MRSVPVGLPFSSGALVISVLVLKFGARTMAGGENTMIFAVEFQDPLMIAGSFTNTRITVFSAAPSVSCRSKPSLNNCSSVMGMGTSCDGCTKILYAVVDANKT